MHLLQQISADSNWERVSLSCNGMLIQTRLDFLEYHGSRLRLLQEPELFVTADSPYWT